MVNPGICRRCPHNEGIEPVERNEGDIVRVATVKCGLDGDILLVESEAPENCPYVLEHLLVADKTQELVEGWSEEIEEQQHADAARFQHQGTGSLPR